MSDSDEFFTADEDDESELWKDAERYGFRVWSSEDGTQWYLPVEPNKLFSLGVKKDAYLSQRVALQHSTHCDGGSEKVCRQTDCPVSEGVKDIR